MAMAGSDQAVGTIAAIPCTYSECEEHFETVKEMKWHKKNSLEHDYCKKCDVDCVDWEELTQHKVTIMDEYYRTRHDQPRGVLPKHITCEFCGEDFGSFGGRRAHRKTLHPADQEIRCRGCDGLFTRASNMIAHLEFGNCPVIMSYEFKASIQHKQIIREIMDGTEEFERRRGAKPVAFEAVSECGMIEGRTEDEVDDEGGIPLLDGEHDEQLAGYEALEPAVDLLRLEEMKQYRATKEAWPRLPGLKPLSANTSPGSMSVASDSSSTGDMDTLRSEEIGGHVGLRVHPRPAYGDVWPALNSPTSTSSPSSNGDSTATAHSTATATQDISTLPWSTGTTSQALFQNAPPTPRPADFAAWTARQEEAALTLADTPTNLFHRRFYDCASPDWCPALFFNAALGRYCCPFPRCDLAECQFADVSEVELHLDHWHLQIKLVCPTCLKRFASATAQVAHMESEGRCGIKESAKYKEVFDVITGGFLKTKRLDEPFIMKPQLALVKAGEKPPLNGVMSHEYKAKLPHEH
ncbi:hypothetical protein LTR53_002817 [Teratosphaeriaceae sp. CCFEE 6253]|nr:hypothetical protein LTR53_002817 [Teratosphaeriaceae sp. CCFEE 6253]